MSRSPNPEVVPVWRKPGIVRGDSANRLSLLSRDSDSDDPKRPSMGCMPAIEVDTWLSSGECTVDSAARTGGADRRKSTINARNCIIFVGRACAKKRLKYVVSSSRQKCLAAMTMVTRAKKSSTEIAFFAYFCLGAKL